MLVTASALRRDCGYARKLNSARPRSASAQDACDRGTLFHKAVEDYVVTGSVPTVEDSEVQGWVDLLVSQWHPISASCEVLWGLSPEGEYVEVKETAPHVYESVDGSPLLTAGRGDVVWWDGGIQHADWKSGRWAVTPAEKNLQVNAGGIALARKFGENSYRPHVYYARDGYWDTGPWVLFGTPAYLAIWHDIKAAALLDETARPGPHCSSCWERKGCAFAAKVAA